MLEPFALATSHFIMNSTPTKSVQKESSPAEQELYPLRACNREANGDCGGKENGTCLAITENASNQNDLQSVEEDEELTGYVWNEKDAVSPPN